MNEKLKEFNSAIKLEKIRDDYNLEQRHEGNKTLIALPLSAFQKELEEAANEPLFTSEQSEIDEEISEDCCSEATHISETDETDCCSLEDKPLHDVILEHKNEIATTSTNANLMDLNNISKTQFTTPTTKNTHMRVKYTPSLMAVAELNSKQILMNKDIFQTPGNNSLVSKNRNFMKYNFRGIDKTETYVPYSENKISNSIIDKTIDDSIHAVKQVSLKNDITCIKQLSFNGLTTPTVNRGINSKLLETPRVQCSINFNSMRTGGISNSAQKITNDLLNSDQQCFRPSSETKKVVEATESNKQEDDRLQSLVPNNSTRKGKKLLEAEIKYVHSLKKIAENPDDKKLEQDKIKVNKRNKENVSNNNPNGLCTITIDNGLKQFDKIVVNNVEYIILNELGKGGSSVVYHCYNPVRKTQRAIKKVSLRGDKACVEGYINEVKMLHKLQNCDRIIKMYSYEILKPEKILYVVLEKGDRDLSSILKDLSANTTRLPIYMVIFYWMEMLFAVQQIHQNGIIHSDLKPANFLVVHGGLKLIDFGIASSVQTDMTSVVKTVQIGSVNYISPEAIQNNNRESGLAEFKISYKSDVWSLGCILYQLVYRKTPFQHIGHMYAKLTAMVDPNQTINYPEADWVPPKIIETIKACLKFEMRSRPSVDELTKQYESFF